MDRAVAETPHVAVIHTLLLQPIAELARPVMVQDPALLHHQMIQIAESLIAMAWILPAPITMI